MATLHRFEDLEIWKKAFEFDKQIFEIFTREFANRDYSLKDQITRASGSIMDNIAEGFERSGNAEFHQFLSISKGSCGEVRSQLYRCEHRGYITANEFNTLNDQYLELSKKIASFMNYLRNSGIKGVKYQKTTSNN